MNLALQKMQDNGLFDEQDVKNAVSSGIEQSAPLIAQNAVEKAVSPDNVKKKIGLYKQGVVASIGQIGALQ